MTDSNSKNDRILLVEDEESMALGLEFNLVEEGYMVEWAKDGREAISFFNKGQHDLVILDIMLPFFNGFEVAEKIREQAPQTPILMLTARTGVDDRVKGLVLGADDYMTKPFHLPELLARVKGMLKRKTWYQTVSNDEPKFVFGENEINFNTLKCQAGRKNFTITTLEAMVLRYLINHAGQIVSRKELLENVWNISSEVETRTVDNFIMHLRKYFEPEPSKPQYIKSVRGKGYLFEANSVN
ncbi:MAG: response regulator transcription factor [Deltaproteobacteria bacterium]|jgi:two-component system, OmpR family, alkaline phosphatase synthesis response regulator PhoP|nr:response regulator transcription factor [Deltaproteobacteria bacterium]MBT4527172.1 response regulator transcription factor [Deltaproteobacteria bacterium]